MATRPIEVDERLLRSWPLPWPENEGSKEERGRVLLVAGCVQMPGAAVLAATAALRAGAGKLRVATTGDPNVIALAVPEARVLGLKEASGDPSDKDAAALRHFAGRMDSILVGAGVADASCATSLLRAVLPAAGDAAIILDAAALDAVRDGSLRFPRPPLLTPHAGEMAHLLAIPRDEIVAEPARIALEAASQWNSVVALKGAVTYIATPDGQLWRNTTGNVGLATCGSGDVLAGIIAGLAARGASLEQAAVWGVALHARAGDALAQSVGSLGYLARELAAQVPALMDARR